MKKKIWSIWLTVVLGLAGAAPSFATIISVEVTGVVDSVETDGGLVLDGSVFVGSAMTGFCTYDTEAPDLNPSNDWGAYPLISISMSIGNYTFTHELTSLDPALFEVGYNGGAIYWINSYSPRFDGIVTVNGSPKTYDDITWNSTYLRLIKIGASEYPPDYTLPDSFPDFSVFDMFREFRTFFYEPHDAGHAGFDIRGEVTSLTPEPASILLLSLGGLALLRKRRA